MDELLKRFIKRNNKKKGLNITVATMVMFLLNCSGVYAENDTIQIKDIVNNGILNELKLYSSNHIANLINLKNNGKIISQEGKAIDIYGKLEGNINALENSGEIQGIRVSSDKLIQVKGIYNNGIISGEGIKIDSLNYGVEDIDNIGVIRGKENAISARENGTLLDGINNFGLLIGKAPISNKTTNEINNGLKISLDNSGEVVKIESENKNGITGVTVDYKGTTYTVINGKISENNTNTIGIRELSEKNSNLILNGVDNTLTVDESFTLNDSVVNAYKTAIKIQGDTLFSGNSIVVNGGGLNGETAVISGDENNNTLNLSGNTVINGNIDLGSGKDKLVLGAFDGTTTYSTNNSVNINSNISGVENIEVNQDVNISQESKISGVEKITIGSSGNLTLGLKDNGEKLEHALTESGATIVGTGVEGTGNLVFNTENIGKEAIIDMTGVKLENVSVKTDSDLYGVTNTDGEDFKVTVEGSLSGVIENGSQNGDIVLPEGYERLEGVFQGFTSSSDFEEIKGKLTKADKVVAYTKEIAFQSPYALSSELSRKSIKGFTNIVEDKDLKPELGSWAVTGGLTHTDGGYSSEGLLGSNTKLEKYRADVDSKLTGIYTFGEYGLDKDLTLGLVFGANNLKSELTNGSNVDGTSIYLGGFAKKYLGNLRLLAGAGYQYGDYQGERYSIIGSKNEASYSDNAFTIYTDAKYSHMIGENLYLEPSIGLDYIYISQEGIDENGKGALHLNSKDLDYTGAKIALDIRKDIVTAGVKHSLVAGAFYDVILDGEKENSITTKFNGSKEFDTVIAGQNEHNLGLRAKYEVALESGVSFDIKGNYIFARDSYSGVDKNKAKSEWSLGAGIGYKF
mgnify:CR=1 FL=1